MEALTQHYLPALPDGLVPVPSIPVPPERHVALVGFEVVDAGQGGLFHSPPVIVPLLDWELQTSMRREGFRPPLLRLWEGSLRLVVPLPSDLATLQFPCRWPYLAGIVHCVRRDHPLLIQFLSRLTHLRETSSPPRCRLTLQLLSPAACRMVYPEP